MTGALAVLAVAALTFFVYRRRVGSKALGKDRVKAMTWRIRLFHTAGPGWCGFWELFWRWGRLAAATSHGGRARPSLTRWQRFRLPTVNYAVRLGRGAWFRTAWSRMEDHILRFAPPRTGKTASLASRVMQHPGPVITSTSRPDIHRLTFRQRGRLGPVYLLNPLGVDNEPSTFTFDLLGTCTSEQAAYRMADWLTGQTQGSGGNTAWFEDAGALSLCGLLLAAAIGGYSMQDVFRWNARQGHAQALEVLRQHGNANLTAVVSRLMENDRTAAGYRDVIFHSLKWTVIPELAAADQRSSTFNVDKFLRENGTLNIISAGDGRSTLTPFIRAVAAYCTFQAAMIGMASRHHKLEPPLLCALDEVAVTCPIDLPAMLSDSAGKGIMFDCVAHSMGQLEERYGKYGADAIWNACGTKALFGGSADPDVLDRASRVFGSTRIGDHDEPRVPGALVRAMPDWWALIVRTNRPGAHAVRIRKAWKVAAKADRRAGPPVQAIGEAAIEQLAVAYKPAEKTGDEPVSTPKVQRDLTRTGLSGHPERPRPAWHTARSTNGNNSTE
jgi:hypothetical protein